jgi:hypothetical protein
VSLSFLGILFLFLFFVGGYYRYFIFSASKIPYYVDAFFSPKVVSPVEAYEKCLKALDEGDYKKALRFIAYENKKEYQKVFKDKELVENILKKRSGLKKVSDINCEKTEICKRWANYKYEYEVLEKEEIEAFGKKFLVSPGKFEGNTYFIKNIFNKWQIISL